MFSTECCRGCLYEEPDGCCIAAVPDEEGICEERVEPEDVAPRQASPPTIEDLRRDVVQMAMRMWLMKCQGEERMFRSYRDRLYHACEALRERIISDLSDAFCEQEERA